MRRLALVCGLAALAIGLGGAPQARAHALLASSQPADGAQLASAPSEVVLTFTETPDPKLSSIHVLDSSGAQVERGAPKVVAGEPRALRAALGPLGNGVYTVTWRTVSRVDGHVTGGAFAFGVGEPVGNVVLPSFATPRPSVLSIAGRAIYYAGLFLLIGAALGALFVFGGARPAFSQQVRSGFALSVLGALALGEAQRRAAGASFGAFARTSLGRSIGLRAAPLVLGIVIVVVLRMRRRSAFAVAGIAGALSFLAHVAAGHAGDGRFWLVNVGVQWVHVVAASLWIGGLVALLAGLRGLQPDQRVRAVRRFSAVALYALVFVAGTGTARAINEVGSLHLLFTSSFGQLVIAKSALLLALLGLGALNRYRGVPHAGESGSLLERVSRAEIAIAAVVLALTGILSGVAPGKSVLAAERAAPKPVVVTGADFGTTVKVRLTVSPGSPGRNSYELRLRDYDTGAPVVAERVSLRFAFLDETLTGTSAADLRARAPGVYEGSGTELSLDGRWRVTVVIQRGADSVEIPLELQTLSPPQKIDVIPGNPTLYNITLTASRSVQMYVDPGKPGANEVHATFFQNGGEFAGLTEIRFTAVRDAQAPVTLPSRTLSPGHFVAAAQLSAGRWKFTVRAVAPDGARLTAHFEQAIA